MAANKEFHDAVLPRLEPLGEVTSKPMFGGYGVFHEGAMFALISGDGLFFKVDDRNRERYTAAGSAQYKPMPYFRVPPDVLAEGTALLEWARLSVEAAHTKPVKKPKR